jgi:hypothetical protein
MNTVKSIHKKVIIFQIIAEKSENSILSLACINAKTDEFIKETNVKIEIINIDIRAILLLYPGKKYAIHTDKIIIIIHKMVLRVITFDTIFVVSLGFFVISLIVIVYSHKSARNAKIHK